MQRLKEIIKKVVFYFIKPPIQYIANTYSQAGEDSIIRFLLQDKNISSISYLDIGTNKPDWGNNTYLFYTKGSRGVCVEADKTLIKEIQEIRKEDKVLNIGVNIDSDKYVDFYVFNESSLNTFNKEEAEFRQKHGSYKIISIEKVELKTLEEIIVENFQKYPDLLSLDIEGLDLMVIKSLNLNKFPIPIICMETCTYSENNIRPKDHKISEYMISNGYFAYADTYINTIFVNKDWFYSK